VKMSFFSREVRITTTHYVAFGFSALNLRGNGRNMTCAILYHRHFAMPDGKSWQLLIKPGLYLPSVHLSIEDSVVLQIGLYLFFPSEPKPMVRDVYILFLG
jgi:hypothetical protein